MKIQSNTDALAQIDILVDKQQRWGRVGLRLMVGGGLGLIVGGVGSYTALQIGPITHLAAVDIPASVLAALIPVADAAASSGSSTPLSLPIEKLMRLITGSLPKFTAVLMIIIGGVLTATTASMRPAFFSVVAGSMFFTAPLVIESMLPLGAELPEKRIHYLVDNNEIAEIQAVLSKAGVDKTVEGRYILAQAALVSNSVMHDLNMRDLSKELALDNKFKPNEESLYAIDVAAYGKPQAAAAQAYEADAKQRQRWVQFAAAWFLGVGGFVTIGAAAYLALYNLLARRVKRIKGLMGQINAN